MRGDVTFSRVWRAQGNDLLISEGEARLALAGLTFQAHYDYSQRQFTYRFRKAKRLRLDAMNGNDLAYTKAYDFAGNGDMIVFRLGPGAKPRCTLTHEGDHVRLRVVVRAQAVRSTLRGGKPFGRPIPIPDQPLVFVADSEPYDVETFRQIRFNVHDPLPPPAVGDHRARGRLDRVALRKR